MSHAVMCGNVREEERAGCFVPWCTCWCHRTQDDEFYTGCSDDCPDECAADHRGEQ